MAELRKDAEYKKFMEEYTAKLAKELEKDSTKTASGDSTPFDIHNIKSKEYQDFKKELLPRHYTLYENACNFCEKFVKFSVDKTKRTEIEENIKISHLNITPEGVLSFSLLAPMALLFIGAFLSIIFSVIFTKRLDDGLFFALFFVLAAAVLIFPLSNLPKFFANDWRMRASNQMVLCVFYIVTYMRHTSNLERAIEFASDHLGPPLSLDLRKVLWDVEVQNYATIKESLADYLDSWKKWNMEFVEAIHLIESSLYEPNEPTRLEALNKSLSVMLEETYEKMLHFAQNLKSPLTMLNMLGIILPILGLVILPLVFNFLDMFKWYHLALLYNIALPISVFYIGLNILSTRPTGYGDTDISDTNPELKKKKNLLLKFGSSEFAISPKFIAVTIFIVLFSIGISPLVIHAVKPDYDLGFSLDKGFNCYDPKGLTEDSPTQTKSPCTIFLLEYRASKKDSTQIIGPFGLGAAILSLFIPLSIGLSVGVYHSLRSKNVIAIRERTKALEKEFASALFQLGNRLGDNIPAEVAFEKVASVMEGTLSGDFFTIASNNVRRMGLSVDQALFDPKVGAILTFPSSLIESSMKVMAESSKKGPKIASQALISVSEYIKEMHRVDERLKDLLADVISSMQSQINFLTPVIAGIVVGIASMITTIMGKISSVSSNLAASSGGQLTAFTSMISGDSVPTFYLQAIVGIYVVQIVYILVIISNGVENGADNLSESYNLGKSMIRSTLLYFVISLVVMLLFNIISTQIIGAGVLGPGT